MSYADTMNRAAGNLVMLMLDAEELGYTDKEIRKMKMSELERIVKEGTRKKG